MFRNIAGKDGPGAMQTGGRDRDGRSGTILLVEDSDVVRDVIARMLEEGGFTVLQASGGEEALAMARRGDAPIDLLLTDIFLPGMSGVELADRMAGERCSGLGGTEEGERFGDALHGPMESGRGHGAGGGGQPIPVQQVKVRLEVGVDRFRRRPFPAQVGQEHRRPQRRFRGPGGGRVNQQEIRTGHVTRRRTSVVHVHDLEVPLVLAERATLRDLLHVDLELLPALGAQDDPFAHGAASLSGRVARPVSTGPPRPGPPCAAGPPP